VKHLDWLQFHLPVLYKVVGSLLQDMHLCFPIDAVCTICGEPKATHDVKHSGKLDLTSFKDNDCISGVIEPNADADGLPPILNAFVDSGEFSAAWFLPSSKNVSSGKSRLPFPYKLLAEGPLKALLLSDVQYFKAETISSSTSNEEFRVGDSFVATELCASFGMLLLVHHVDQSHWYDEFAPEDYFQVLSATYPSPLSKKLKTRCIESNIYGDGPKCSKAPAKSYFQNAPAKIDVSQFFTSMGSKTWSIAQLEIWHLPSLLPCSLLCLWMWPHFLMIEERWIWIVFHLSLLACS